MISVFSSDLQHYFDPVSPEIIIRNKIATQYRVKEILCAASSVPDRGALLDLSMPALKGFITIVMQSNCNSETLTVILGIESDKNGCTLVVPVQLACEILLPIKKLILQSSFNITESCKSKLDFRIATFLPGKTAIADSLEHYSNLHVALVGDILRRCQSLVVQKHQFNLFDADCYWNQWDDLQKESIKAQIEQEKSVLRFFERILVLF